MENVIESNRSTELGMEYDDVECFLLGKLSAKDLHGTRESDEELEDVPLQFEVEADIEPVKEQPYEMNEPIYEELPDTLEEAVYDVPPDMMDEPLYDDIVIPKLKSGSNSSPKHHHKRHTHHHGKHHHRHHHHRHDDGSGPSRPLPPVPPTPPLYMNPHNIKRKWAIDIPSLEQTLLNG